MKTSKINYRKFMAICAVLAITLIQSTGGAATKGSSPRVNSVKDPDLTNEERVLERYLDDLFAFDSQCATLNKKPSLLQTDLNPLQTKSDDLKRRLADVQNAIREVVKKLKAADRWDDLDATVLATTTDSQTQARFRESSFKKSLEDAAAQVGSQGDDLNRPLDNLRKKLTGRVQHSPNEGDAAVHFMTVGYSPLTTTADVGLRCRLAHIRVGVSGLVHGHPTHEAQCAEACTCNPPPSGICLYGGTCPGSAN